MLFWGMTTAHKPRTTSTKKQPDTPRAVIYARVSDDKTGHAASVNQQQEAGRDLITRRHWRLVNPLGAINGAFVDNSITGSGKKHRPAFYAMLDAVRRGEVDAIVARHQDRLARNPRERLALVEACRDHGVIIALVQGTDMDPTTASGRVVIGVLGEIAEMEIALKSERHIAALERHAKAGRAPHGRALLGYTTTGKVVAAEAKIVRRIFAGFAAGESLRSLARALTADGVPTRSGRPWNTRTIRDILHNPRYAGWVLYRREILTDEHGNRVRGQWQPLVDADEFDVIQARLADPTRKTNKVGTHRRYLGSSLFVCDQCGTPVQTRNGGKYFCTNHLIRDHTPIDHFVVTVIAERLARPDFADLLAPDAAAVKPLTDAARTLRRRLEIAENDYATGLIDGKLLNKTKTAILADLTRVESEMAALTHNAALSSLAGAADPAAAFRAASVMGQRAIIAALCEVRVGKAARGRPATGKHFDPKSVTITWKDTP